MLPSIDESPEVLAIDGKVDRASWWHTDVTFLETPAMASILYMLEAPEVGGDTMWASLQDAYDGLAEPVRAMCDRLIAIHHDPLVRSGCGRTRWVRMGRHLAREAAASPPPVVRTRPETGRNGLFVNRQFTRTVFGFSDNESNAILEMLYNHCVKPETPAGSAGAPGRSPSGTTGPRCTTHSMTTATLLATPTGSRCGGTNPTVRPCPCPWADGLTIALAAGLPADLGIAAAAFVGTNIDNALVTMAMVAGAPLERSHRIAIGQVIGFAILVAAAAAAAAVLYEFSPAVVGLLGLVPLAIGVRGLIGLRSAVPSSDAGKETSRSGATTAPWADHSPRPHS